MPEGVWYSPGAYGEFQFANLKGRFAAGEHGLSQQLLEPYLPFRLWWCFLWCFFLPHWLAIFGRRCSALPF